MRKNRPPASVSRQEMGPVSLGNLKFPALVEWQTWNQNPVIPTSNSQDCLGEEMERWSASFGVTIESNKEVEE